MTPADAILLYAVLPVWLAAGFADWLCHRRLDIEHTAGPGESALHLLMLAEVGIPTIILLLCEPGPPALALMLAGCVAHSVTTYVDTRYAGRRREIGAFEQQVHGYLEVLPYAVLILASLAHWEALQSFADWRLRWRESPLPPFYLAGFIAASIALGLIPYAEELLRGLRARRHEGRQ